MALKSVERDSGLRTNVERKGTANSSIAQRVGEFGFGGARVVQRGAEAGSSSSRVERNGASSLRVSEFGFGGARVAGVSANGLRVNGLRVVERDSFARFLPTAEHIMRFEKVEKVQLVLVPQDKVGSKDADGGWWQPLGLLSIATFARAKNPELQVEILDEEQMNFEQMKKRISEGKADVVGLSPNIANYSICLELAEVARASGARVVFGGHHATGLAENILRNRRVVDVVVLRDGEIPFSELVAGKHFAEIPGIVFRGSEGEIVRTRDLGFPALSSYPDIDYSLVNLESYFSEFERVHGLRSKFKRPASFVSQRGCTWREVTRKGCVFCARVEPSWRGKDVSRVWREIRALHERFGIDSIADVGDDFTGNAKWFDEFFAARPNGLRVGLQFIYSRAANILRPGVLEKLVALELQSVLLGIESGDVRCLKAGGKGMTPDLNVRAVKMLNERGIGVYGCIILGMPGEDEESLKKNFELCKRVSELSGKNILFVGMLMPLPNSPAYSMLLEKAEMMEKYGGSDVLDLQDSKADWLKHFTNTSVEQVRETLARISELPNCNIEL